MIWLKDPKKKTVAAHFLEVKVMRMCLSSMTGAVVLKAELFSIAVSREHDQWEKKRTIL